MFNSIARLFSFYVLGNTLGKRLPITPCGIVISRKPSETISLEQWCEETNAGKGYHAFEVFEDPNLVTDAGNISDKYKREIIIKAQNKYNETNICAVENFF